MGTSSSSGPASPERASPDAERNFRWNAVWFTLDGLGFSAGAAFANGSTVLPSFVSQLTGSTALVGLLATVQNGSWLLPQLVAARALAGRPRKRGLMLAASLISRPSFILLSLLVFLAGTTNPTLLLAGLFAALMLFYAADSFVAVAWFDIWAKAVPPRRRGRLQGVGQLVTGPVGIGIGALVGLILSSPALAFPYNYGLIFGLAGIAFFSEILALAMLREPVGEGLRPGEEHLSFISMLKPILRHDRRFTRLLALRLCFGVAMAIFPFYIVYAERQLGFGPESIGLFLSAQLAGGMLAGIVFGQVADKRGTRAVIRLALLVSAVSPAVALLVQLGGAGLGLLLYVMAVVFVANGAMLAASQIGFMNYVLEIAPASQRPTYAGLYNTINGSLLVVPVLTGLLLERIPYTAVFAAVLLLVLLAAGGSLFLAEPRHQAPAAAGAPEPA